MPAVSVKLAPELCARMQRLAARRQRTAHWLMRTAIHQYVEREEARDAFLQAGRDAWREHRDTGLHASAAEVLAWLETWGEDTETAAPACHE